MRSIARKAGVNWRAAALAALVLVAAIGCDSGQSQMDIELDYIKQVKIRGYEQTRHFFERSTIAVYVGQPAADVIPLISGPDLKITIPTQDFSRTVFEHLADGVGHTAGGKECRLRVYRLSPGTEPFDNWNLSDEQTRTVTAGEAEVIRIEMGCEPFHT